MKKLSFEKTGWEQIPLPPTTDDKENDVKKFRTVMAQKLANDPMIEVCEHLSLPASTFNKHAHVCHECVALEAQQIADAHSEAAELDAGFDGGEFSAPAHSRMQDDELAELAKVNRMSIDQIFAAWRRL